MKKVVFLLFMISSTLLNAQIGCSFKSSTTVINGFTPSVGGEFNLSNISISAELRLIKTDQPQRVPSFGLWGTFYLWPRQSSPFFAWGIITRGHNEISEITGKPVRSAPLVIGYRFYPTELKNHRIDDRLSFDIKGGSEICEKGIKPYLEISGSWTLFK